MKKYFSIFIFLLTLILLPLASAATPAKTVDSGDTIFWIIATVVLTCIFAMRGIIKLLLNPVYAILFVGLILIAYILISAINIAYGIGDSIDTQIQALSEVIK